MRRTSALITVSCLCSKARAGSKKPLQLSTLALLAAPPERASGTLWDSGATRAAVAASNWPASAPGPGERSETLTTDVDVVEV
jgi:hypothetical protein